MKVLPHFTSLQLPSTLSHNDCYCLSCCCRYQRRWQGGTTRLLGMRTRFTGVSATLGSEALTAVYRQSTVGYNYFICMLIVVCCSRSAPLQQIPTEATATRKEETAQVTNYLLLTVLYFASTCQPFTNTVLHILLYALQVGASVTTATVCVTASKASMERRATSSLCTNEAELSYTGSYNYLNQSPYFC